MANLGKVCNLTFVRIDQLTQYNILNGNNIEEIFIFDILQWRVFIKDVSDYRELNIQAEEMMVPVPWFLAPPSWLLGFGSIHTKTCNYFTDNGLCDQENGYD